MRTSSIFIPNIRQHVATGWPNACNTLHPTMLRNVAFICCDCLAELANAAPTMLGHVALGCSYRLAGALYQLMKVKYNRLSRCKYDGHVYIKFKPALHASAFIHGGVNFSFNDV